jgi:hypothetical protein
MRQVLLLCLAIAMAVALFGCSSSTPPVLSALAPTPTQVLTELEAIDAEMRTNFGTVHPNCATDAPRPLQPGERVNCTQYLWTKPITRTEWSELFPRAHFFLIGARRIENLETNRNGYYQDNSVIAQQNGQRYNATNFEQLFNVNGVATSDRNLELVAKVFTLMNLANYLEKDIIFSEWENSDWPARFGQHYNYAVTGWTKLEGNKFQCFFLFRDGVLVQARGVVREQNTGDYINVPVGVLRWPNVDYLRRTP